MTEAPEFDRALLDAINEGLAVVREGRIIDVNDALCRMTGFRRAELVGAEMPWPFMAAETLHRVEALHERLAEMGRGNYEIDLCRADGGRFPVLASAGSAITDGGELLGWVFLFRDIS